jgi:drug/metabolite transporter (DMT)-like permease
MTQLQSGVLIEALSVSMGATGMVIEKLATRRLPPVHARKGVQMVATLVRDPLWVLGFTLLFLGLGTQVLALTLAPISIVQAVAACGITLFLVLSHFVLGERLNKIEYLGIAAILTSLLLLGMSVNASDDHVSGSASLAGIFVLSVPAMIVGIIVFLLTDRLNAATPRRAHLKAPLFGISSGLLYGVGALALKEMSTIVKHHGLVDGVPRVLISPGIYLFLVSTCLGFLVFQTALQRTMASVFVPVNNVTSSSFFIVFGTLLFHERFPSAETPFLLRLGSFALILVGLAILALGKKPTALEEPTVEIEVRPSAPSVEVAAHAGTNGGGHKLIPVPRVVDPTAFLRQRDREIAAASCSRETWEQYVHRLRAERDANAWSRRAQTVTDLGSSAVSVMERG